MTTAMTPNTAIPPMTPPTIMPMLAVLLSGVGIGEGGSGDEVGEPVGVEVDVVMDRDVSVVVVEGDVVVDGSNPSCQRFTLSTKDAFTIE